MRDETVSVLIVGETRAQAERLRQALTRAAFRVLGCVEADAALEASLRALAPDAILIHADCPARDTLEHLALINSRAPRPTVMLCGAGGPRRTREAARAGVSLYVVDEVSPQVVESLLHVAMLHFQDRELLRRELEQARRRAADREAVNEAKCLLMERERLAEVEAYARLRHLAMSRRQALPQLARALLAESRRGAVAAGVGTEIV